MVRKTIAFIRWLCSCVCPPILVSEVVGCPRKVAPVAFWRCCVEVCAACLQTARGGLANSVYPIYHCNNSLSEKYPKWPLRIFFLCGAWCGKLFELSQWYLSYVLWYIYIDFYTLRKWWLQLVILDGKGRLYWIRLYHLRNPLRLILLRGPILQLQPIFLTSSTARMITKSLLMSPPSTAYSPHPQIRRNFLKYLMAPKRCLVVYAMTLKNL